MIDDLNWKVRETKRFLTGIYKPLYFADRSWFAQHDAVANHYPHVSKNDPMRVAYTPNESYGRADRQLSCSVGSYLAKYYADVLTENERRAIVEEGNGRVASEQGKLLLASEPDEIVHVYRHGPSSCMSHAAHDFGSGSLCVHPTYVYGAGDLAVAHIKNRDNRISARCLVWPERLAIGRIYGDADRLRPILEREGYRARSNQLEGARMLRIDMFNHRGPAADSKHLIGPYVDFYDYCEDDGTHLYIGNCLGHTCYFCQRTDGLISERGNRLYCHQCDEEYDPDYSDYQDPDGNPICESCFENECSTCEACGDLYWSGDGQSGELWHMATRNGVTKMRYQYAMSYCYGCYENAANVCEVHDHVFVISLYSQREHNIDVDQCPLCYNEALEAKEAKEDTNDDNDTQVQPTEEEQVSSNNITSYTTTLHTVRILTSDAETGQLVYVPDSSPTRAR